MRHAIVLLLVVLWATMAAAAGLPKGLGTNEAKEKVLAATLDKLVGMPEAQAAAYRAMRVGSTKSN